MVWTSHCLWSEFRFYLLSDRRRNNRFAVNCLYKYKRCVHQACWAGVCKWVQPLKHACDISSGGMEGGATAPCAFTGTPL